MSVSHLILRAHGPHTSAQLQGCHVVETSIDQLVLKPSALGVLSGLTLGSVVLEDLHLRDVPPGIRSVLIGREGVSCPVVSRWTNPRAGDAS